MSSVEVTASSSEHEIRNALSRCYYAVMHACKPWLILHKEVLSTSINHKVLQAMIRDRRGPDAGKRLQAIFRVRWEADYRVDMLMAGPYYGDLEKFRVMAISKVEAARQEMQEYQDEVGRSLNASHQVVET